MEVNRPSTRIFLPVFEDIHIQGTWERERSQMRGANKPDKNASPREIREWMNENYPERLQKIINEFKQAAGSPRR